MDADADDVAGLFDGRIGGDFVDALFVVAIPAGVDLADDVNLVSRAVGEVDIARSRWRPSSSTRPLTERLRSKVASEANAGSAASMRTAVVAAKRCFIVFLDSEDGDP